MAWIHARTDSETESAPASWPAGEGGLRLNNGLFLTPKGALRGSLSARGGLIESLESLPLAGGEDLEGDMVIPGLVELHTDNLEKHIMPRPGIYWTDPLAALEAHDAQLASSGITTVFDSVCVGEPIDKGRRLMLSLSLAALAEGRGNLRADHLLHLRCEVSAPDMEELLDEALRAASPDLVSVMDHTPGQRQWRTPKDWLVYHQEKMVPEELMATAARLKEARDACAARNTRRIVSLASERGITLASHDDTDLGHIEEAVSWGARISEFPTTLEAARGARDAGLMTVMGTPNLVRGGSHSGNVKVSEVARERCLSCLSSDYVPSSLLHGAWKLFREHGYGFGEAVDTVTRNPAEAAGLRDRGEISPGKRADLVRVRETGGRPRVIAVWVKGERVF
ncbi:MAG: alpha-D-ribose 1-methylphosphonate 5-triphosphate diphosphatase [Deltaproteobacteria bacterium]|jgi:alpha-D-ribose 1-methylphosphonate 5-triphosphate diphosphatase|nr:alpha-D-ribose 1-methylphosphonate 5-triphosphate diphosphatase [Deltaproteobacteria bacterium]